MNNFAQGYPGKTPTVTVTGKVIDQDSKQALEYATIIFSPLKGKRITGGITDAQGNFSIDVRKGQYTISIEYISFKTKTLKTQAITQTTSLGVIALQADAEMLDAIEIIAEKSTVEIRLDKKIYNVGKDMTVKGGSASDVLDNVPSVTVDVEGKVSLRGNENVRILINGKPSGLVGLSGTDALRQLPADAIQKIEVITSPSARYAAEGTAGIINIILRKGKALGFNGSTSITIGNPFQLSSTVNLNYRTKKVNFFSNFSYSDSETPGHSYSNVTYLKPANETKFRNEYRQYDRDRNRFSANGGMEIFITDNSNITLSGVYRKSKSDDLSTNSIVELKENNVLKDKKDRLDAEKKTDESYQVSLNYTKDFNDKGHQLSLDAQYNKSVENEYSNISENYFHPNVYS
ncbi:MAG: TonB-dependent receptor, partial [Flavobacteriaceae bacterium]